MRWKGIRKRALGLWPAGGPVRAFWDQKGLNYGAVSPELSPPPPLHMCTPGWRFGFTLCTDTLLALLKTSVRPSISLAFTRSCVVRLMFVRILLINILVEQCFQHEFVHVYHCTSDPSWKTKSIKFSCNNCYSYSLLVVLAIFTYYFVVRLLYSVNWQFNFMFQLISWSF